ncbi:MAG: flagellar biosynthesis protein FlhA [Deltaproteobacteria bacterium]|nr:flagellar biosynthesis protein FlhA [Deltaproteobacteria bacterium]
MVNDTTQQGSLQVFKNPDIQFAVALLFIIIMMFIPLPPFLLDILLSISITSGFLIILTAIYISEPLQFSTFPTFLLLSTLARLSLNVATTRNILMDGASGNVSKVITAFGDFVVGGNYVIGFVIFLILVIINFIVITKGAGRVAEVGARFTLDAMPGKQMSIDADLNAGIIDRDEAKKRRQKIEREADFYGAMDGASKFIRGDAIASIIITFINIVVGLTIGVLYHNMSVKEAAQVYTLLTVGDGLVSQIPAIVISTAAGVVVTRANGQSGLSAELSDQILLNPKALYICAGLLLFMAVIPGLPTITLILLSIMFFLLARFATKEIERRKVRAMSGAAQDHKKAKKRDTVESLLQVDTLSLEVGVGLIPLVDNEQDGEVLERIVSARKQFAGDLGIIVPMVMVRDNTQLKPGEYQILLKGNPVAKGNLLVDHELAMAPEDNHEPIDGIKTKEPAYGLDAVWIKKSQRDDASFRGYTVVNCATVIVTHLTKVIQDNASQLLGRQETQTLIDSLKERSPKVVEEVLGADSLNLGIIVKVLQNLLQEGVSIKDLLSVFETLADHAKTVKNPVILTRHVRKALGRNIVRRLLSPKGKLTVASLDRGLEDLLISHLKYHEDGSTSLELDPETAQRLLNKTAESMQEFDKTGSVPVLLCGSHLRWDLRKLISRFIPGISLVAFDEIPSDMETQTIAVINL